MDLVIKATDGIISYTKEFRAADFRNVSIVEGHKMELVSGCTMRVMDITHSIPQNKTMIRLERMVGIHPHEQSEFDKNGWERTPKY